MNKLVEKPIKQIKQNAQQVATTALATIEPEQYVIEVYAPFKTRLAGAIERTKDIEYNIQTTAGMETAKECRALFRNIRLEAEKEREARKAPILSIGRLLDSTNKEIEKEVSPHETRFDLDIKAEEKRKEDIKLAAIKAEEERKTALNEKIEYLRGIHAKVINLSADATQAELDAMSVLVADEASYQERFVEAEILIQQNIETLKQIIAGKRAQEAMSKQITEQQNELNRIGMIRGHIDAIKNNIILGAECQTSAELEALIVKVNTEQLGDFDYAEFSDEAMTALSSTVKALSRQLEAMQNAEKLAESAALAHAATAAQVVPEAAIEESPTPAPALKGTSRGGSWPTPAPVLHAVVVENQDVISSFLKTRNFGSEEHKVRAILVEFVKFSASYAVEKAA